MRIALFTAGWLSVAVSNAVPTSQAPHASDKRLDTVIESLNGKVLQSDIQANIASFNQKLYQASQRKDQWKKCHAGNLVERREW